MAGARLGRPPRPSGAARLVASLALLVVAAAPARAALDTETWELFGTLGAIRIGARLTLRDDGAFLGGHYFYVKYLKDIALSGHVDGPDVTLAGADGGTFHLRLVGARPDSQPLNFGDATGLRGSWTSGATALPVTLAFDYDQLGVPAPRVYDAVTAEPDAAFEARVRRFLAGALAGDRSAVAAAVSYPLTVNRDGGKPITVKTRESLLAQWNAIFTPAYVASLKDAVPHDLFVRNGMAMLAGGAAWFDDKGAAVLNQP